MNRLFVSQLYREKFNERQNIGDALIGTKSRAHFGISPEQSEAKRRAFRIQPTFGC